LNETSACGISHLFRAEYKIYLILSTIYRYSIYHAIFYIRENNEIMHKIYNLR